MKQEDYIQKMKADIQGMSAKLTNLGVEHSHLMKGSTLTQMGSLKRLLKETEEKGNQAFEGLNKPNKTDDKERKPVASTTNFVKTTAEGRKEILSAAKKQLNNERKI